MDALLIVAGLWLLSRLGKSRPAGPMPNAVEGWKIVQAARSVQMAQQTLSLPSNYGVNAGLRAGKLARPPAGGGGKPPGGGAQR